jgi:SAM-dependent methyltransferase
MLLQEDVDYFNRGEVENKKFWARLGNPPLLKNAVVLDVGCGHGSLCVDAALSGARKVVGLDLDSHRINFANENLKQNYPQLIEIIEFRDIDLQDYNGSKFDVILSKDSFEHILDLDIVLENMKSHLNQSGRIYIGFAPLYCSPTGDHGRTKIPIPWGHLLISERIIIERLNRRRTQKINSIYDLGLNKMSLKEYRNLLNHCGLKMVYFRTNVSDNLGMKVFSLFSKIKPLEEYFTHNLYCILEKV